MDKHIQLGFIARLAREVGNKNKLGRKAFQKLVHLSNDLAEIPTGYSFSFYLYGPFSRELSADLEIAEAVKIISQDQSSGAYDIKAGEFSKYAEQWADRYFSKHEKKFKRLLVSFAKKPAKTLELYSTIVFIEKAEPELRESIDDIIRRVIELKPKYKNQEIKAAVKYLEDFRQD